LGRFLQEDPIWFNAGDMNVYRYVWNSPVNWRDPSGKSAAEYGGFGRNAVAYTPQLAAIACGVNLAFSGVASVLQGALAGDTYVGMQSAGICKLRAVYMHDEPPPPGGDGDGNSNGGNGGSGDGSAAGNGSSSGSGSSASPPSTSGSNSPPPPKTITKTRKSPEKDGGTSTQTINQDDKSRTHTVRDKNNEIVHQHQDHTGKEGSIRQFPSEWTGTDHVDAPYTNRPPNYPSGR
jgi:hypothetical protein